ncbi:hypothetical protein [Sphingomonas sp. LY160]|uniref:hypothetical protein n=1 Tax=Sphingomonas sp. LY160 TaxID=3095342 RepID=UPI002ADED6AA|nr:hypothetical protein [Sphingomonas sp. LY160]MEA1071489.1 hypothetical protein [Sphingomonas sp. LY160]
MSGTVCVARQFGLKNKIQGNDMLNLTTDQWIIILLIFVLGLLVGGFLFSGGGRKWKQRYNAEVTRRTDLEKTHAEREREWRERDSLRDAAVRDRNRDGVISPTETKPGIVDRMLGRDRDGDGIPDDRDPIDDRDRRPL